MTRKLIGPAVAGALAAAALALPAITAATGIPQCATGQLKVSLGQFDGGVGHGGYPIIFKNTGRACSLRGYPGVDGLTASGKTVVHASRSLSGYLGGTHKITTVTVATGKTASAFFEGLNSDLTGKPCPKFAQLAVTPPNDRTSVRVKASTLCYPSIHPVVPGSSGSQGQ
jgi:Protein of unknown function (DUF4232)